VSDAGHGQRVGNIEGYIKASQEDPACKVRAMKPTLVRGCTRCYLRDTTVFIAGKSENPKPRLPTDTDKDEEDDAMKLVFMCNNGDLKITFFCELFM
jgi:hypothetical protein